MSDLNKIIKDLANNDDLKIIEEHNNPLNDNILLHGFPGENTPKQRIKPASKKQTPLEYEAKLIDYIEQLNKTAMEQKAFQDKHEMQWERLKNSQKELALLLTDDRFADNEKIKIKYELLGGILETHSEKTYRKPKEVQIDITQSQIVILFHHMKQLGMIGKNVSNTIIASCMSEMSGFSKEKIRQALSTVKEDSTSVENAEYVEYDYTRVRNKIQQLKENIELNIKTKK